MSVRCEGANDCESFSLPLLNSSLITRRFAAPQSQGARLPPPSHLEDIVAKEGERPPCVTLPNKSADPTDGRRRVGQPRPGPAPRVEGRLGIPAVRLDAGDRPAYNGSARGAVLLRSARTRLVNRLVAQSSETRTATGGRSPPVSTTPSHSVGSPRSGRSSTVNVLPVTFAGAPTRRAFSLFRWAQQVSIL